MKIRVLILSFMLVSTAHAAQQIVPGGMILPNPVITNSRTPTYLSNTIDAVNEEQAVILQAPKTGTISKVGWMTGTVTTGATVDVRLETVSTTDGFPTDTLFDTNTNGSQVVGDGDDDTWFTTTLTAGAAVTKGDILAVTIVNPGSSAGDMEINAIDSTAMGSQLLPYGGQYIGSPAWEKTLRVIIVALEYSDGSYEYIPNMYPASAINSIIVTSASDPDEAGLKFSFPFPVRLTGMWAWVERDGDVNITLYDSDGSTALETLSIDKDIEYAGTRGGTYFYFAESHTLAKDTYYRVTFVPTEELNVIPTYFDVNSAAVMDAIPGGQEFHWTQRTDAGAWTDTTTRRPNIGLIIDGFDDGVQVGGGGTNANGAMGVSF